jgi:hypothetical protein
MRSALVGIAGAVSSPTRLFGASGDKLSKQQAEYQDSPKGIQMCATCTLFVAPRSCKVVEGDISPGRLVQILCMADQEQDQPLRDEHAKPNGPIVITVRHPECASSAFGRHFPSHNFICLPTLTSRRWGAR